MDLITISEACRLLGVSRPTLDSYRKKYNLQTSKFGGKIRLSKTEVIKKILLSQNETPERYTLSIFGGSYIRQIEPIPGVYDLRKIKGIDAFGVMALLCSIKAYLNHNELNEVHLLLDGSPFCSYLESIGFFAEVERSHRDRVSCDYSLLKKIPQTRVAVILPLHLIGYRGAEKKILNELYDPLLKQGFSESCCGYIGWIVGELCDNAHTHSEGPCYLIVEALQKSSTETRYLSIAIGDTGIGIPVSLKKNTRYENEEDRRLLPMAFKSEVSRMEVEPKRGKGLNDIIGISKGNRSCLRVESNNLAVMFDFRKNASELEFVAPIVQTPGTRFCLLLIDAEFKEVPRIEVNNVINEFLERI
ncbi:MAG: helix-turn-helix domain-containing protein [Xanthomonadaceae bacterium]|nr:helix-turn-helix domain-containing protein [Xanthomonadaceae bacterium]